VCDYIESPSGEKCNGSSALFLPEMSAGGGTFCTCSFFSVALTGIEPQEFQPLKSYGSAFGDVSCCLESCGTLH